VVWISAKKLAQPLKTTKKCNITDKKIEEKKIRGTISLNKSTKFGADWNIFMYKNCDTFVVLQTHKHFFYDQIVVQKA